MATRLLTIDELVAQVAVRLKREPGVLDARAGASGTLEVAVQGERGQRTYSLGLENLYRLYLAAPTRVEDVIEMVVQQSRTLATHLHPEQQSAPETSLFPQLKDEDFLRSAARQGVKLLQRPFAANLSIVYVADDPSSMRFLTESDLAQSGWTLDDLHAAALTNLARKAAATPWTMGGEGPRTLIISQSRDSYDAARILLPDVRAHLAGYLGGRILFGIPNRDFLVALGDMDAEFVREIAAAVRRDFEAQPYPLSPGLFVLGDGGEVAVYQPA